MNTNPSTHSNSPKRAKSRITAALIIGSVLALGGTTVAAPVAYAQHDAATALSAPTGVSTPTPEQVAEARALLTAELERLAENPQSKATTLPAALLAKMFGKALVKELARKGAGFALHELFGQIGLGSDGDMAAALSQLQGSIDQLNSQVTQLHEKIKELLERDAQRAYEDSYRDSLEAADNIDFAFRTVTAWVENDREEIDPSLMTATLTLLSYTNNLASNTTDPTVGTIPKMMAAVEFGSGVSDQVDYWLTIAEARESYRASMAMGLAAYSIITERWDPTGSIHDVFEQQAAGVEAGVSAMYALGIAHQQPAGSHRYVNVQGSDELLASVNSPAVNGQEWQELSTTRAELESRLQDMESKYQPVDTKAPNLENYLTERGIPSRYDFADTYRVQRHNGPIVCDGGICFPLYYEYSVVSVEGYFDGDRYRTREVTRAGKDRNRSQMEQRRDQLALAAAKTTVKRLSVSSNSANRAADFDAQRTEAAALGDVMSWNSAAPVAEGRYLIDSPTAGPIAVSRSASGHPRYPLFGTARSALDGEWFEIENVGLNEYILKSETRGYVQVGDLTLAGGATRDQAHRFDIRTSDDGRTWFQSVTWSPYHWWIGEERRGHSDVFRGQGGDMANDFADGYDEEHFFTLTLVK